MFYVTLKNSRAVSASTESTRDANTETRHDWKTLERAEEVAAQLTEATGTRYIGIDSGANVWPRFDVIEAPVLGAEVSTYFNGDAYPEGVIVKISASLKRVETSTGKVFNRRRQTGSWRDAAGWGMIPGHRNDRNPSF